MLGLLFMAPEIGDLVIEGVTRKMLSIALADVAPAVMAAAKGQASGLLAGLADGLVQKVSGTADDMQTRVRTALEEALQGAGAALGSSDEVGLLLEVAAAAEGQGDLRGALERWNTWRAANPSAAFAKPA